MRKKNARWLTVAGAAAATTTALLLPTIPALAENPGTTAEWEMEELPLPEGYDTASAHAIDPTGSYVGGEARILDEDRHDRAALWHDGEPFVIEFDEDESQSSVTDVNSSGTAVGFYFADDAQHAFLHADDETTTLPLPDDITGSAQPFGVNEDGLIVGTVEPDGDNDGRSLPKPGAGDVAVTWSPDGSEVTVLDEPEGSQGAGARDIDEDGNIGGFYVDGTPSALRWDADGTPEALGDPDEADDTVIDSVAADWTAGYTLPGGTTPTTTRWAPDAEAPEVFEDHSWHADISPNGEVATSFWEGASKYPALLDADGEQTLLPSPSELSEANGITDDGTIISGWVADEDAGVGSAVLWTPAE